MTHILTPLFLLISTVIFSQVVLNEAQSSNSTTISDELGDYDDWIEIHNPTSNPIEIGGLILKDQLDTWMIPTGDPLTLLPPNGYFILWADDEENQGIFHTNFKLSAANGEFLGLYENDGITVIDSITLPPLLPDMTYGRCGDEWIEISTPSPLSSNDCTVSVDEQTSLSNSFYIHQDYGSGQAKIELLGQSQDHVNFKLYSIYGTLLAELNSIDRITYFNTSKFKSGIYFVVLSSNDFSLSKKILIAN